MISINNSKRIFRRISIIIVFFAMYFLGGCSSDRLITRAYPMGPNPRTTEKIIDQIATETIANNIDNERLTRNGRKLYTIIPEEKYIVVQTTLAGHNQIEASLKRLEEQSTNPGGY